jgi:hypothetical protein
MENQSPSNQENSQHLLKNLFESNSTVVPEKISRNRIVIILSLILSFCATGIVNTPQATAGYYENGVCVPNSPRDIQLIKEGSFVINECDPKTGKSTLPPIQNIPQAPISADKIIRTDTVIRGNNYSRTLNREGNCINRATPEEMQKLLQILKNIKNISPEINRTVDECFNPNGSLQIAVDREFTNDGFARGSSVQITQDLLQNYNNPNSFNSYVGKDSQGQAVNTNVPTKVWAEQMLLHELYHVVDDRFTPTQRQQEYRSAFQYAGNPLKPTTDIEWYATIGGSKILQKNGYPIRAFHH